MKKRFALPLIIVLIFLATGFVASTSFGQTNFNAIVNLVSSGSKVFGGKVANTKAEKIEELESSNYGCAVSGSTIEVIPINRNSKNPVYSYAIPAGIKNKTGFPLRDGQWIIGKYSGKTTITCILEGDPPLEETVTLSTITLYGTSKL